MHVEGFVLYIHTLPDSFGQWLHTLGECICFFRTTVRRGQLMLILYDLILPFPLTIAYTIHPSIM